jgi:hypothetical protein
LVAPGPLSLRLGGGFPVNQTEVFTADYAATAVKW